MPCVPKFEAPVALSQPRYAAANGAITVVSKARLSMAPTLAVFLARP